jgi:hypothetical protein
VDKLSDAERKLLNCLYEDMLSETTGKVRIPAISVDLKSNRVIGAVEHGMAYVATDTLNDEQRKSFAELVDRLARLCLRKSIEVNAVSPKDVNAMVERTTQFLKTEVYQSTKPKTPPSS